MIDVFKLPCHAHTAEEARLATVSQHARPRVSWIQDTIEDVLRSVEAKRVRAEENPALYADKLREYAEVERRIYDLVDSEESSVMALIEALALNDDSRLADRERVCAVWISGDRWIVFGAA